MLENNSPDLKRHLLALKDGILTRTKCNCSCDYTAFFECPCHSLKWDEAIEIIDVLLDILQEKEDL